MNTAADVAAYILGVKGPMTAMKLQKLAYYAQAWSLVWDDRALFGDAIQAWANGPVIPSLYAQHRGRFEVKPGDIAGNPDSLDGAARETIAAVLDGYGRQSSQWLSELTHSEKPWIDARKGLDPTERGTREITLESMAEYYGSL